MNNSIAFMAPHKLPQTTIVLPNPRLNNSIEVENQVKVKEMMDGSLKTYVRRTDRHVFDFDFELTAEKDEELRRFVKAYSAEVWRFYHWDGTVWLLNLVTPKYASTTVAVDEYKASSLQLQGVKL